MLLKVISTGSKGNCYLLQDEGKTLVLDAGVQSSRIVEAVDNPSGIAGFLITHEHMDHFKAAPSLAVRHPFVLASKGTWDAKGRNDNCHGKKYAAPGELIHLDGFTVLPFEVQHDAAQPLGFLIRCDRTGETLVYATDTFYLKQTFPGVNYWLVECNYCDDLVDDMMLYREISVELRNRLKRAHMSLKRLKNALQANDLSQTRKIVICHLSDARSDEERMVREISYLTGIDTVAADDGMIIDLNLWPF